MMDPLTALSVAGTIIQFVDFGSKLVTNGIQLYKYSLGSLEVHEELELITGDIQAVVTKLRKTCPTVSAGAVRPLTEADTRHEERFRMICEDATLVAEELLSKLNAVKVKSGKHHVWESLKAAVNFAWSKDEISSLKARLSNLKESLELRSLLSMEDKIDATFFQSSTRFDSLDTQTQQILEAIVSMRESFSGEILNSLTTLIRRSEIDNEDLHLRTRRMISYLRNSVSSQSSSVDVITAQIEMLNVGSSEEKDLRNSVDRKLLRELAYPNMTNRYEDIVEAHPKTFDWIFAEPEQLSMRWSNFGKWLRDDTGIFWINGKAGSGKSTLMKHIYDDPRTRQNLERWICKDWSTTGFSLCVATFFFWNSGTNMQQSQQGLLRSLLYQIFSQHTNLIPVVFPKRWAELYLQLQDREERTATKTWSMGQLHEAFETLMDQEQYHLKMCFFIDGLDEFSGDVEQLCLFFRELSGRSDKTKFCLSSRPWVQFQENLASCPSLRLQDLTYNDINTYVNDKFYRSPAFMRLANRDANLAVSLVREIGEKAEGVFLWVKVVVRQLLCGISGRDSMDELWTRLRSFPRDLYPLYDSILSQIEPMHLEWASRAFQVMIASAQLSSDPFRRKFLPESSFRANISSANEAGARVVPLTLIEFTFAMDKVHDIGSTKDLSVDQLASMFEETQIRLTARCAGLIEVSNSETLQRDSSATNRIRWMHRTARDFVCQSTQSTLWTKTTAEDCFREPSVCFALMKACIMSLSVLTSQRAKSENGTDSCTSKDLASNSLIYAYHTDGDSNTRKIRSELLTMLMDFNIPSHYSALSQHWDTFLHRAALYCLSDFVGDMLLKETRSDRRKLSMELLHLLCSPERCTSPDYPFPTSRIVNSLLRMAALAPRHFSGVADVESQSYFPGVLGTFPPESVSNLNLHPFEVSSFIKNQLSIVDYFLQADMDPTDSLGFLPKDFVLHKETMQLTIRRAVQNLTREPTSNKSYNNIVTILTNMKLALVDAVSVHKNQNHSVKKRKRCIVSAEGVISLVDDSDSEDVIFVAERRIERGKRVKTSEEN